MKFLSFPMKVSYYNKSVKILIFTLQCLKSLDKSQLFSSPQPWLFLSLSTKDAHVDRDFK